MELLTVFFLCVVLGTGRVFFAAGGNRSVSRLSRQKTGAVDLSASLLHLSRSRAGGHRLAGLRGAALRNKLKSADRQVTDSVKMRWDGMGRMRC